MYFYFIIALQGFCLYHLYKNRNDYYWVFIIILLPLIGSLIYIFTQVLNKRDVDAVQNEITAIIQPTKKIKDLHKKLEFSDSYQNRIDLADAYFELKDYNNAVTFYEKSIEDEVQDNTYAIKQLIKCFHNLGNQNSIITYSEKLKGNSEFKGSKEQFYYGMALEAIGKNEDAELQLQQIDKPYSNYDERLELARFYMNNDKRAKATELLNEINTESQHMTPMNRRIYRSTINEVRQLLKNT